MRTHERADGIHHTFYAEIKRGMKYLDKTRPGWERKVDSSLLDLASDNQCVLGQVCGSWESHLDGFNITVTASRKWSDRHGFTIPDDYRSISTRLHNYTSRVPYRAYQELTEQWLFAIKDRFDSGNLSESKEAENG